ncbi:hypothetical protein [Chitinophaga caseinilytica]|uniref:hypothetical protein n=1 Tax=Chitinophaga caseinilytica TaxID=2267521 RepID=UPI003C308831
MKKLKLKLQKLGAKELLSRDQLKNILGGEVAGSACTGDKFSECVGKSEGTACCFTWSGTIYTGKCYAFAPDYKLHCSDLN